MAINKKERHDMILAAVRPPKETSLRHRSAAMLVTFSSPHSF